MHIVANGGRKIKRFSSFFGCGGFCRGCFRLPCVIPRERERPWGSRCSVVDDAAPHGRGDEGLGLFLSCNGTKALMPVEGLLHCVRNDKVGVFSPCNGTKVLMSVERLLHCVRNDNAGVFSPCNGTKALMSVVRLLHCVRNDNRGFAFSPPSCLSNYRRGGIASLRSP